mgnify:CR=1 FL=1
MKNGEEEREAAANITLQQPPLIYTSSYNLRKELSFSQFVDYIHNLLSDFLGSFHR